jgi:hypothetical protein
MPANKKSVILTFDYEVFLGRETGTIRNCVLNPTNAILRILKENNATAIFFVDATWLKFLKEEFSSDFHLVAEQLRDIVESGSSVELHLHPQWIDAYKTGNQIVFSSYKHYKLHTLSQEEIFDLFANSVNLLQSITSKKIYCFRAGGWCIEPFNKIEDAFKACGIKYDFSVVPGLLLSEGKDYDFDYSRAPQLPFYSFYKDIQRPDRKGMFTEFPLTTYSTNPFYRIVNKVLLKIKNDQIFGDGIGNKGKSVSRKFFRLFNFSKEKLSLDNTSSILFKYLLSTHLRKRHLIVAVSHPKLASKETLQNLKYVIRKYKTLSPTDLESHFI